MTLTFPLDKITNIFPRMVLTPIRAIIFVALVLFTTAHWSFWSFFTSLVRPTDIGFCLAMAMFLLSIIVLALNVVALPFLLRPILTIILWIAAASAYFMDTYGVRIDVDMIRNAIETDRREAVELLTVKLFTYLLLIGALPSLVLWKAKWQQPSILHDASRRIYLALFTTAVMMASIAVCYKDFSLFGREHKQIRMLINPFYPIYAFSQYILVQDIDAAPLRLIAEDAHSVHKISNGTKPRIVILLLGETARASQFGLNGYKRNTTPKMANMTDIVNFSNVWSCGTATAVSLPCMFSNLGRDNFNVKEARSQESILDILHRSGVQIIWRDNNSGCKGVCDRLSFESVETLNDSRYCVTGECFDEILLEKLPERIASAKSDMLIVLHQKGSHGPAYYKRTPENMKQFKPECSSVEVKNCDQQSIINAYDNTIVYTDHLIAKAIDLLKKVDSSTETALLYVSDHGESLGENGIYLHGFPYAIAPNEQKKIPMIFWESTSFLNETDISIDCLQDHSALKLSADNIFHSLLGIFDVKTTTYKAELDLFLPCKQKT